MGQQLQALLSSQSLTLGLSLCLCTNLLLDLMLQEARILCDNDERRSGSRRATFCSVAGTSRSVPDFEAGFESTLKGLPLPTSDPSGREAT